MKQLIERMGKAVLDEADWTGNKASVHLTELGEFTAGTRSLAKVERMDKRKMAQKIRDEYERDAVAPGSHTELSYWMDLPKAIIDIVYADMFEGGR
jgi:hypothetical protein